MAVPLGREVECVEIACVAYSEMESVHQTSVPQVTVRNRKNSNVLHLRSAVLGYTGNFTVCAEILFVVF